MKDTYLLKTLAVISLALQLLIVVKDVLEYCQTNYVLASPLLPQSAIDKLLYPQRIMMLTTIPFLILSIYVYRKQRYVLCFIMGLIAIAWNYLGAGMFLK